MELFLGIVIVTVIAVGRNIMNPISTGYINSNFETDEYKNISLAEQDRV